MCLTQKLAQTQHQPQPATTPSQHQSHAEPPPHICSCHAQRHDLFQFIRATMYTAAMYPLPRTTSWACWPLALLEHAFELFLYFVVAHIAALFMCTLYLHFNAGDLEFLVNCLIQTIIYTWAFMMKLYFRRVQPHRLHAIMELINVRHRTHSAAGLTYVTMRECLAMSNRWIKVYVSACFVGVMFWLILPIANGDRSLPLSCWYPFDYRTPIIYETVYFLQSVGQLQIAAAFAVSSGYYMVLAILISGQYDVLNCSIKNIIATSYINSGATAHDLSKLNEKQQIANAEVNQYYCSQEKPTELACLTHQPHESSLNFAAAFKLAFKACVEHHRYILQALEQMEKFYNPIWLFKTAEVTFLMCLVAFVSVKSTSTDTSFIKILTLAQYLLLVAWEMLIICYFGEIIFLNSQRCGEAMLRSPWYLHAAEIKHDMLFFVLNSQRSFRLTAGKIYNLNVERFRTTCTTAFSFLTLLQKMDKR